jgi:hypothetical protein
MRAAYGIIVAISLGFPLSLAYAKDLADGHIITSQYYSGCEECKYRWRSCRDNCNSPSGMGPTYQQCMIICDTAGQACVQRFCR